MKKIQLLFVLPLLVSINVSIKADDGYRLWLKYDLISNQEKLNEYRESIKTWVIEGNTPTIKAAEEELQMGLKGLLGSDIPKVNSSYST